MYFIAEDLTLYPLARSLQLVTCCQNFEFEIRRNPEKNSMRAASMSR